MPQKPTKFSHLHVHSHYSLLDGLSKIDDLLDRAKELGMDSMALTDHGSLYGAVEFYVRAKERDIKPIIGCEVYVAPNGLKNKNNTADDKKRHHLVLLVKNDLGYHNLMKMITISNLEGFFVRPRVDHALLEKYHEGLIALSACAGGEVPTAVGNDNMDKARKLANWHKETFGEGNYYLEIQDHPQFPKQKTINEGLITLGKELAIPLVATTDSHYLTPEDSVTHDVLLCIQTNRKVNDVDRWNLKDFDLSLRSPEDMIKTFADTPEAITNTQVIADKCNLEIRLGETQLPHFPLPEGKTAQEFLTDKCEEGLVKRFGSLDVITQEQRDRMAYELDIIKTTGYASYFLIVADFVNWAKENGIIVGPGRGSAAGSFVSYLTEITNMDPIEYKLLFERFLNPERVSMPDVDLDFPDDRREDVLDYVRQKYGNDHVAQIVTFGTMASRAAIRDAGRALGLPYDFCDRVAKLIPMFTSINETLDDIPEFKELYDGDPDAKQLIDAARHLEGVCRHASVHACGVVITKEPVTEYTPLQHISEGDESVVTQYASSTKFSVVEKIGLLKMDFLGLKNLTIIQNALKIIKTIHKVEIDIEKIPLDDEETFALLQSGLTTGVFQLESSGMKRYLKQLKPSVLEDVIAMVALYRPGPMEWIPDFIANKHGEQEVVYLHPKLEPILADTYGVAVYQEQVMKIAQELAGFTLGEADILRKAMGKKILELIKEQRVKFVKGCVENGVNKDVAEKVFTFIEPFAGYGFNRSHAACYGLIGYQTAYLKAHYPAEYMAALMTADQGDTDRIAIEAAECRSMDISVLPPDINESFEGFAVIYDEKDSTPEGEDAKSHIRFGLNAIKNVGHPVAHAIVWERNKNSNYTSLSEFLTRIDSKDLNKRSVEALAKVGAFDSIGERAQIIASMDSILAFHKEVHAAAGNNQGSLFGTEMLKAPEVHLTKTQPARKKEMLTWEKELLGLYVSGHPSSDYMEYIRTVGVELSDLTQGRAGQTLSIGGIVVAAKKILTKRHQAMLFVTLEDMSGQTEVIVFPKLLEVTPELWAEGRPVLIDGELSDKRDELKFLANSAKEITQDEILTAKRLHSTRTHYSTTERNKEREKQKKKKAPLPSVQSRPLTLTLPDNGARSTIERIKAILDKCSAGETQIFLSHGKTRMKTAYLIDYTDETQEQLAEVIGAHNIK